MALDNQEYEEKPLKLVESEVEVASDYTKRKNVFRVKTDGGSEYLFQVRTLLDPALVISASLSYFRPIMTQT